MDARSTPKGPRELDAFEVDAKNTADALSELAVSLEVKGLNGGAAICKRASKLIYEVVVHGR